MQDLLSQAILAWTRQKALMTRGQLTTVCSMGLLLGLLMGLLMSFGVSAITAPAAGSFAYDLYDVAVNDIVKGAPGFVGGVFGVAYSATKFSTDWKIATAGILASTMIIKADTVTTTLGALV